MMLCLVLVVCQGAAAWSVTNISIEPSGALTPGTPVLVSVKIDFPEQPAIHQPREIRLVTDLEKQKWIQYYIAKGYEDDRTMYGGKEHLLDWFPVPELFGVRFTLEGTAPLVTQTSNITILRIVELNEKGEISASERIYEYHATVINPSDITPQSLFWKYDLQGFRTEIDEFAAMGVNTTGAEAKYQTAKTKIDAAYALREFQYMTALENITAARADIAEGERLLDKAWAEKEIADAEERINQIDGIIAWCIGNKTTASHHELLPIINKREIAVAYTSMAKGEIYYGNFSDAQSMAQKAYAQANETYNDADTLYQILNRPVPDVTGKLRSLLLQVLTAGFIVIILSITGYFWWKKRKSGGTV
ncbi:MAG TPA: hypothetical protein HA272_01605 [Methanoregula sp.]|nr:hypothetical protein [Methanoregula sp.]